MRRRRVRAEKEAELERSRRARKLREQLEAAKSKSAFITARNSSCGKVMFSQACVIPSVKGGDVFQHAMGQAGGCIQACSGAGGGQCVSLHAMGQAGGGVSLHAMGQARGGVS